MQALGVVLQDEQREVNRKLLSRLVRDLSGYFDRVQAFCSCFSLAADELPMWAAYGQSYSGLAIGFRPAAILGIPGRVYQVKYLDPSKENDEFKELALKIAGQVNLFRDTDSLAAWVSAGTDAIVATLGLKHRIWAYEKEVRVIYVQRKERPEGAFAKFPVANMPKGEPMYWREPLERNAGTRSVKYVEFPFGRFHDGKFDPARALKTIIVGPNCPLSVAAIEAELTEQGFYDCIVKKSDCQIRV